jgi:hypothetical protein
MKYLINMSKFFAGMGLSLSCSFYNSWLFTKMWFWFIVPLGAIPLTVFHAMGISLMVSWFTIGLPKTAYVREDNSINYHKMAGAMINNSLALSFLFGIGYIVKNYI